MLILDNLGSFAVAVAVLVQIGVEPFKKIIGHPKSKFKEALKICEMDKKWPRESMNELISLIKAEIASVE